MFSADDLYAMLNAKLAGKSAVARGGRKPGSHATGRSGQFSWLMDAKATPSARPSDNLCPVAECVCVFSLWLFTGLVNVGRESKVPSDRPPARTHLVRRPADPPRACLYRGAGELAAGQVWGRFCGLGAVIPSAGRAGSVARRPAVSGPAWDGDR